jgi:hypothetical protein
MGLDIPSKLVVRLLVLSSLPSPFENLQVGLVEDRLLLLAG